MSEIDPEVEDDWWCDFCDVERPWAWQCTQQGNYLICRTCQEKQHKELRAEAAKLSAHHSNTTLKDIL